MYSMGDATRVLREGLMQKAADSVLHLLKPWEMEHGRQKGLWPM